MKRVGTLLFRLQQMMTMMVMLDDWVESARLELESHTSHKLLIRCLTAAFTCRPTGVSLLGLLWFAIGSDWSPTTQTQASRLRGSVGAQLQLIAPLTSGLCNNGYRVSVKSLSAD